MGVQSAKVMVMSCLLANILAIAVAEKEGRAATTKPQGDDLVEPYCQFKDACFGKISATYAQFVESEPLTDDQTQPLAA